MIPGVPSNADVPASASAGIRQVTKQECASRLGKVLFSDCRTP